MVIQIGKKVKAWPDLLVMIGKKYKFTADERVAIYHSFATRIGQDITEDDLVTHLECPHIGDDIGMIPIFTIKFWTRILNYPYLCRQMFHTYFVEGRGLKTILC